MAMERKCGNCIHERLNDYDTCYWCKHNAEVNPKERETNPKFEEYFAPKEELVRQDERDKFITLLKSDLENFDGIADDCVERKDIHELLESNAVRKYIESTIELLEKEQ